MSYRYQPFAERLETRRRAAMDVLGAVLLAFCVFLPLLLWSLGVLG